jgi:hypothetical protein
MHTSISIKLSKNFDESLFQIAALYTYSKIHDKYITIPDQNEFMEASKMFDSLSLPGECGEDYYELSEYDNKLKIVPHSKNIMLVGKFKSFKLHNDSTLEFMREYLYSCEDYMYAAYNKYNEIKNIMNCDDDEMVSMYFDDCVNKPSNIFYYKKALILMNKKNIVVFSPQKDSDIMRIFDEDHNIHIVWDNNPYIRFILLSFFKNNVVQYYDAFYSMWAAYVSKYNEYKTVVVPDYLRKITNEKINNMNIVYLD